MTEGRLNGPVCPTCPAKARVVKTIDRHRAGSTNVDERVPLANRGSDTETRLQGCSATLVARLLDHLKNYDRVENMRVKDEKSCITAQHDNKSADEIVDETS